MTYKIIMSTLITYTALLLAGCDATVPKKGHIPEKTAVSINFVRSTPGKTGKMVILGKHGQPLKLPGDIKERKKLPAGAKLKGAVKIRFYQVNPCWTEVCFPGWPCVPVEGEGDCTVADEPIEEPPPEDEPTYITCHMKIFVCMDDTYQASSCPKGTEPGACP